MVGKIRNTTRKCSVEGCTEPFRSALKGVDYCRMHYFRVWRHGSTVKRPNANPAGWDNGRGYRVYGYAKGHPLAKLGKVLEHRMVLYDSIGPGPHSCHWCGDLVNWSSPTVAGRLVTDHLNSIKLDNRIENLVPACSRCNCMRAHMEDDALIARVRAERGALAAPRLDRTEGDQP